MNNILFNKKIVIMTIIFLFFSSYATAAISENNIYDEKSKNIFDDKKDIKIVLLNNILTRVLKAPFLKMLKISEKSQKMVDPAIDEGPGPFSYFSKPTYQMGLPGEKYATQITPEGHLFTCAAELEFFAGENLEPISQRIWTLYKGYIPCIQYQVEKDEVLYDIQTFQYWLDEEFNSPPINYVKATVKNMGMGNKEVCFSIGFEYGDIDHRSQDMRRDRKENGLFSYDFKDNFNPFWKYEMTDFSANRENEIIYLWNTTPSIKWEKRDEIYQKPFHCLDRKTPVCIGSYIIDLSPNQTMDYTFKMPFTPIEVSNGSLIEKLRVSDFDERLNQMAFFWESIIESGMSILVPEDKVINTSKASLVNMFMCQDIISEDEIEPVPNRFQLNRIWLRDCAFSCLMYSVWNYPEINEKILRNCLRYQSDDGDFSTQRGELDGTGNVLFAFGQHIRMTQDAEFAQELFPHVVKAVEWIKKTLENDRFGLMPAKNAWDGDQVFGHSTSDNLWSLMGLDGAIAVARVAGAEMKANEFTEFRNQYYEHFMKQLRKASSWSGGIIPPGLDVYGGLACNNLLVVYPGYLLDPFDPLVTNTFNYHRKNNMEEGLFLVYNSLHNYFTARFAQTALARGEQELVLKDFYSMLLHTGACHEGFEYCIFPWSSRDYVILDPRYPGWIDYNFPPHSAFSSNFNILLRTMFIREQNQTLHLLSAISPEWCKPGDIIKVNRSPTFFGMINLSAKARVDGLNLEFSPSWTEPPELIQLHLPFFANVSSVLIDGCPVSYNKDFVYLPKQKCNVNISWHIDPSIEYSYEKFVEDYKMEYKQRYDEYIKNS